MATTNGYRNTTFLAVLLSIGAMPGMASAETIRIGGTGAGMSTMALLGEAFAKVQSEHAVKVLPSLGTSGGLKALQGGALEIAVTARDLKPEEKNAGLTALKYGTTAFVFATHAKVPAQPLTKETIAAIYSGKQANWSNGQAIRLILRPIQDTDTRLLVTVSPDIEAAITSAHSRNGMTIAITDTDSADQIEKTPNAFGTSTLALVLAEDRKVNLLPVDGVKPSVKTLSNGTYAHTKDMYIVTPAAPSSGVSQFIEFVRSPKGAEILKKTGHKTNTAQ